MSVRLELVVDAHPLISSFYEAHVVLATERIGARDPKDIDILALTYALRAPLWTADQDLRDLDDIQTVITRELYQILSREGFDGPDAV